MSEQDRAAALADKIVDDYVYAISTTHKEIMRREIRSLCREALAAQPAGEPTCIHCGQLERDKDGKHIRFGNDLDNPIKHHFEPATPPSEKPTPPVDVEGLARKIAPHFHVDWGTNDINGTECFTVDTPAIEALLTVAFAEMEKRHRAELDRRALGEAEWWHRKLHWDTGIPCDGDTSVQPGFKPEHERIAQLQQAVNDNT